jgi:hypothetical protein
MSSVSMFEHHVQWRGWTLGFHYTHMHTWQLELRLHCGVQSPLRLIEKRCTYADRKCVRPGVSAWSQAEAALPRPLAWWLQRPLYLTVNPHACLSVWPCTSYVLIVCWYTSQFSWHHPTSAFLNYVYTNMALERDSIWKRWDHNKM